MASGDTIGLGRPAKVCIDPGHGGRDSGCVHFGTLEKDLNLAIAGHLRTLLTGAGHTAYITRTDDSYVGLTDRGRFSVAHGSELFVSVHHDSAGQGKRGCSSFVRYESYRNGMDLGTRLTVSLDEEFNHGFAYGTKCQKHWINLGVLRGGNNDGLVTATVVECACLSSAEDFEFIRQDGYAGRAARTILRGIHRHLGIAVPGEEPTPEPVDPNRVTIVGLDGVAREVGWLDDGISYAPVRAMAEACGRGLTWDAETRTVKITEA